MSEFAKTIDPDLEQELDGYCRQVGYEDLEHALGKLDEEIRGLRGKGSQAIQDFMEIRSSDVKEPQQRDALIDFLGTRISRIRDRERW